MAFDFLRRHCAVFISFSAIQAMQLLLPLLALPWLARKLGSSEFGLLMYMCLFPPLVSLVVDWGLAFGGARKCALYRTDRQELSNLLGASICAKIFLALACLCSGAILLPFLPYASEFPLAYFLAIAAGICRGLNPLWFFQGAGFGIKKSAIFDCGASLLVLILTFAFINQPEDWPLYLFFLALCKGCAYLFLLLTLMRRFHPHLNPREAFLLLRKGLPLFCTSFSLLLCYNGGQIGLGYFLSESDMGIIGAINKMARALASLINPATLTLFPELCVLQKNQPEAARKILRWSLPVTFCAALACVLICALLAPWLIRIGLGPSYPNAVTALRIILMAVPLAACNNVLANQILTVHHLESKQLFSQGICALLALPAGMALGLYGLNWGASLPIWLEGGMLAGMLATIRIFCPQALWKLKRE